MNPSTLFVNGNVLTVDAHFSRAEAVLVTGERIAAVGSTRALRAQAGTGTREVDLGGRTLMPGFIDTHGHVALFGLDELKVSLAGATSKDAILARLAARLARAKAGEWIVAMPIGDPPYFLNANTLRANGAIPSLAELDALAPNNPVYIQAPTNRVPNFAVLNSAAMNAAGITADTRVSPHSRVEVDAHGRPTGVLTGAMQPITTRTPCTSASSAWHLRRPRRRARRHRAARTAFRRPRYDHAARSASDGSDELRAYAELLAAGRLPLSIFYTFEIDGRQSLTEIERFLKTVRFAANGGFGSAQVKVVGVSVGLDGPYWHGAACNDAPYPALRRHRQTRAR